MRKILDKYPNLDEKRFMDALAKISVINYENAKRNPNAQTRKWFMSYEQASNRGNDTNPLVGGRLAVSDCSQVTDGACCVILCSEKYIKENMSKKIMRLMVVILVVVILIISEKKVSTRLSILGIMKIIIIIMIIFIIIKVVIIIEINISLIIITKVMDII